HTSLPSRGCRPTEGRRPHRGCLPRPGTWATGMGAMVEKTASAPVGSLTRVRGTGLLTADTRTAAALEDCSMFTAPFDFGRVCRFGLLAVLATLSSTSHAGESVAPRIPQDPVAQQKRFSDMLEWNRQSFAGAYEKVGKKDPRWDKFAREAL